MIFIFLTVNLHSIMNIQKFYFLKIKQFGFVVVLYFLILMLNSIYGELDDIL